MQAALKERGEKRDPTHLHEIKTGQQADTVFGQGPLLSGRHGRASDHASGSGVRRRKNGWVLRGVLAGSGALHAAARSRMLGRAAAPKRRGSPWMCPPPCVDAMRPPPRLGSVLHLPMSCQVAKGATPTDEAGAGGGWGGQERRGGGEEKRRRTGDAGR